MTKNYEISQMTCNIDQEEVKKLEAIASNWWNLNGELKFLHRINQLRLDYITERCSDGLFNKKVLDVGCGGGIFTESMAREGAVVTGLDVSFELLKVACLHALKTGIKINYIYETIEEHAMKYIQKYDIITCMEILEHVPYPHLIINACAKLIKPRGHVFFSTINRNSKSWLIAIIIAEYILHAIPKGTHNILKFIKPSELLNWIDNTILKEKHITGLCYNPFIDKFKLTSNVDINYILHTIAEVENNNEFL